MYVRHGNCFAAPFIEAAIWPVIKAAFDCEIWQPLDQRLEMQWQSLEINLHSLPCSEI